MRIEVQSEAERAEQQLADLSLLLARTGFKAPVDVVRTWTARDAMEAEVWAHRALAWMRSSSLAGPPGAPACVKALIVNAKAKE